MQRFMQYVRSDDVPQTLPHPGQVPNSAGGFSFQVTDEQRLRRFLILGCEGGTYYSSEKKLGLENAQCIVRLIDGGLGLNVVAEIVQCSRDNRAAKQDPSVFALAICARCSHTDVQKAAYIALPTVCRIPTQLFAFVTYCELLSTGTGWSRSHKRGISEWYRSKAASHLSVLVTKYKQRDGWSHADVLRLAHIMPPSKAHDIVFRYAAKGYETLGDIPEFSAAQGSEASDDVDAEVLKVTRLLAAVERCKSVTDELEMVHLIQAHGLVREHVPTQLLNSVGVWEALLAHMPMTAMVRNLGKMTAIGLLTPDSDHAAMVCSQLCDARKLHGAKLHPFAILLALKTYSNGAGDKGSLTWHPVPEIVDALNSAYYLAFANVEPTGQRMVLGIDVSGSMGSPIQGSSITAREGAAAMAMLAARTEPDSRFMAFSHEFVPLDISAHDSLDQVLQTISELPFGATDCSLPMLWALENNVQADCFMVLTDCETYAGRVAPHVALQRYRAATGINAKLVVMGMTSNQFTIADPDDSGMLDVVGFDAAIPQVLREFLLGAL